MMAISITLRALFYTMIGIQGAMRPKFGGGEGADHNTTPYPTPDLPTKNQRLPLHLVS